MTLVVRSRNYSAPTMMGDLLLTVKGRNEKFILPVIGQDVSSYMGLKDRYPVGLAQKLHILGDNVCIACTGDVGEIIALLEDFGPFCSAGLSAQQIRKYAEKHDYSKFQESAYLMMIIEDDDAGDGDMKRVLEISYGHNLTEGTRLFNQVSATGSGTYDFADIVHEERDFKCSFESDDPRHALVATEAIVSRLLAEERYFLGPLQSNWGGGYELVYYNGHKLEKVNNIAYLLQAGNYAPDGAVGIEMPIMINHYRYEDDNLLITSLELHNLEIVEDGDFVSMRSNKLRTNCLSVPPIKRGELFGANQRPVESFETYSVGMGFVIGSPSNKFFKPSVYSGTQALLLKYSADTKEVELPVHNDLRQFIDKSFRDAYPSYKSA